MEHQKGRYWGHQKVLRKEPRWGHQTARRKEKHLERQKEKH